MCPGEIDDFATNASNEPTDVTPEPDVEATAQGPWTRRTFLKAAALGAAAATLVNRDRFGGLRLGAASALADDLSTFQCTANDVRIVGAGQVLNEPCDCTGTFNAEVAFTVENNAASARGCITLHLVSDEGLDLGDIVLEGTIPGKTTQLMTGFIEDYPCGAGLVCFGSASGDGRRRCEAGECSTVSWTVPGQDTCPPDRQISSKCRHQQICIQGRGNATLDCDTSTLGVEGECAVPCGESTTVRLCTTGGPAPYTFTVSVPGQPDQTVESSNLCETFTVGPISSTTVVTGTVTDSGDPACSDSAEVTLTVEPIEAPTLVLTSANCAGEVVLTAEAVGGNEAGDVFNFSGASGTVDGNTITLQPQLDGACRTVSVSLTRGDCTSGETSYSFSQCVDTSESCPHPDA